MFANLKCNCEMFRQTLINITEASDRILMNLFNLLINKSTEILQIDIFKVTQNIKHYDGFNVQSSHFNKTSENIFFIKI